MVNGHERTINESEELMKMVISGHIEAKDRLDKQAEESAKWREESRRRSAEVFELFRKSDEKIDKLAEKHNRLAEAQLTSERKLAETNERLAEARLISERKWAEAQHRLAEVQAELTQAQLITERKLAALIDRSGTP
jgi:malonyl CoA-acyl carrier protein transacylase